ncbi:hypothetical protein PPTG_13042 [Phytophthora nicotianae INRA-310]|uniref:Uncharacterized protein n=1 Tax=Phytophthora nicotianae (strain INRA-310) TaxID=761204 RepID=W2Q3D0_PHYN3|nr:hypothetical protein PPTG_13042 [Phytophthora nicotianae INRA-310]ETN07713.1 hypothetical protein PPTG_13042 [Phytophthora nicotianae INRA-310]
MADGAEETSTAIVIKRAGANNLEGGAATDEDKEPATITRMLTLMEGLEGSLKSRMESQAKAGEGSEGGDRRSRNIDRPMTPPTISSLLRPTWNKAKGCISTLWLQPGYGLQVSELPRVYAAVQAVEDVKVDYLGHYLSGSAER